MESTILALTRAQLLAGNDNDGVVLPNQPQGVIAGTGITISNTGVISVDSSTITGLVRLNNPLGFNSYVWPQVIGTTGQFLQLSNSTGTLTWADAKGFAVVTVQPAPAPSPPDEGELWFDCSTGTLKIYQTCVAPGGWTPVDQSGLPVDPAQTTSSVPWAGSGTTASPYVMSVTTVGSGSSVFVVNTVTVAGLTPFQYVPIVDLNAVANGGRFSFSNYYANAGGSLTFQTIFTDQPPSPPSTTYTANIRVGYATAYINAVVNVVTPLALTQGVISGTPTVNTAVSYTPGTPSGGLTPYTTTYQWFADGLPILGATTSSYTPVAGDVGKTLSVTQTVTDASGAFVSSTATAGSATVYPPIPNWSPTGDMTIIPGGLSGTYTGPGTTMTATGCIEVSINGGSYGAGGPVTSGQVVAIRWKSTVACGGAATPTVIQGSLNDGYGQNDYSATVNRVPSPTINDISDTNVPLNATVSKGIASPIAGLTTTAYVTYDASSTGTAIGASLTPGGPFTALATSGQGFAITNGQTLYIEQTVASGLGVGYTAVIRVGDGTNAAGTYDEFIYTATTTSTPSFPNTVFGPSASDPNATPDTVSIAADPQLGALEGTAVTDASGWQDGNGVSLTATNMLLSVNGNPFASSVTVNNSDSLAVAWDPAYISGIADGTPVTGDFASAPYTNSYGYTVDKNPSYSLPADALTNTPNSTVNTGIFTPINYNSPIALTYTAGTNTMTNVKASIGGGGLVNVPTSGTSLIVNPGQSVRIYADVGAAPASGSTAYSITVNLGVNSQTWTQSVPVTPTVTTPTISAPSAGTTVSPALNSPAGVPVTSSGFSSSGGAGTNHASSDWQLASNSSFTTIVYSSIGDTSNLTSWFIPIANLTPSTTYYLRVRYTSGTNPGGTGVATTSAYSSTINFSTNSSFVPTPGDQMGGGYYGGQIRVPASTGTIYNLIVAPLEGNTSGPAIGGPLKGQYPGIIEWKSSDTAETGGDIALSQDFAYGGTWTATAGGTTVSGLGGAYPLFGWCKNSPTGPNGGGGIGGFTDWYIPAVNELAVLYFFLKPDATMNLASAGFNANSVAPYTPNTTYTIGSPTVTSSALFQTGGGQAFATSPPYWTSNQDPGNTIQAMRQIFGNGTQGSTQKGSVQRAARAIRRVAA